MRKLPIIQGGLVLLLLISGCGMSLNVGNNDVPMTTTSSTTTSSEPTTTTTTTATTTSTTTTTAGCYLGAYVNGLSNTSSFQTMINKNLAVNMLYIDFSSSFPASDCTTIYNYGGAPLITWEPNLAIADTLEAISNGTYDSYITSFAEAAKNWGHLVYLRPAHEMNGNWYPWSAAPTKYVAAWRQIHDLFVAAGASNVKFIWSPNCASFPDEPWNAATAYYPGDNYVDLVAVDGYNWGNGEWHTFDQIFQDIYTTLEAYNKPMMIGEFACSESGGDKAAWITDALSKVRNNYPKIKLIVWFNINKERDWRLESSSNSQTAFRNGIQDSYFSGDRPYY